MDSNHDLLDKLRHLRWLAKDLRVELMLHHLRLRRKYSPNQPRVPSGNPGGGQWTSGGRSRNDGQISVRPPLQVAADNRRQNKMARDIAVKLLLTRDQAQELHRAISGQGMSYHEILQEAKEMFGK